MSNIIEPCEDTQCFDNFNHCRKKVTGPLCSSVANYKYYWNNKMHNIHMYLNYFGNFFDKIKFITTLTKYIINKLK